MFAPALSRPRGLAIYKGRRSVGRDEHFRPVTGNLQSSILNVSASGVQLSLPPSVMLTSQPKDSRLTNQATCLSWRLMKPKPHASSACLPRHRAVAYLFLIRSYAGS
jgi:hypothetical protein